MEIEWIILNEVNQKEKDKDGMVSHLWNTEKQNKGSGKANNKQQSLGTWLWN